MVQCATEETEALDLNQSIDQLKQELLQLQ